MSDLEHKLNKFAREHDCSICPANLKEGCTMKEIVPFLKLTLDWEGKTEGREAELSEFNRNSNAIISGAMMLLTTGPTSIDAMMGIMSLLITYGYIKGREYVEIPKAIDDAFSLYEEPEDAPPRT